jgi:hypothetical protein
VIATSLDKPYVPKAGDFLHPDFWPLGEVLTEDDGYKDSSFPGCQFRVRGGLDANLAVNVKVTGKPHYDTGGTQILGRTRYKVRVRIEFVGDGLPHASSYTKGWLYFG